MIEVCNYNTKKSEYINPNHVVMVIPIEYGEDGFFQLITTQGSGYYRGDVLQFISFCQSII